MNPNPIILTRSVPKKKIVDHTSMTRRFVAILGLIPIFFLSLSYIQNG